MTAATPTLSRRGARPRLGEVLFTADQIRTRLDDLADRIVQDYGQTDLVAVAILNGSFVFLADLARALSVRGLHLTIDFLALASYGGGTVSTERIQVRQAVTIPLEGRTVLLLDDILDSGLTLHTARDLLLGRGVASLRTCVLLDKPSRRRVPIEADYAAFRIGNVFAVGYGLDYDNRYRHLPYLAALAFEEQGIPP
jgi:hypoxanthine phosphoribosyltransferase